MAQISREEWMRKFGRSTERPQPQNIVGLPPADEIAAELAYAQSFNQPQEVNPSELPVEIREGNRTVYRRFGDTSIKALPRGGRYEGLQLDRREMDAAIQAKIIQQGVNDAIVAGTPPEIAFSQALGRPVSPSIASRAQKYAEILDLAPPQAVKLAEREALKAGTTRDIRVIPANWLQAIAESGELGPDPAAQGALRAAMEGVIDVETPIEAQTRALDPYMRAAEAVAMAPTQPYRTLSPGENADISLQSGAGRKLRGGRRNPFSKEVGERLSDPYLVPVLLAEASEPVWRKDNAGQWVQQGVQPPTIVVGQDPSGRKQRVFDAAAVELGLLDPRAPLPADMGYLRFAAPSKEVSGSYGAEVNAPTLERLGDELHGFAARDDIAAVRESVPMTLGQAVQDILYRHSTPIRDYRREDLLADEKDQYYHKQTGTPVFELDNQQADAPVKSYRVGSKLMYGTGAYQEFSDLIEKATGRPLRVIANEKLIDPALNQLQREALQVSLPADWIKTKEENSPIYDIMQALAKGKSLPPADVDVTVLADSPTEKAFYLQRDDKGLGLGIQQRLESLKQAAIGATPDVMMQIPEAARANIEAGLQAPASSPRYRAARDFLARFMAKMG